MACRHCGKDKMLVYDSILTGATCYECATILHDLMNIYDESIKRFYDKLNKLGLMNSFITVMNNIKSDCPILRFMGVKKDKRLKCIYILQYRALTSKKVAQEIEVKISEYPDKAMIKVVYKLENKYMELFIDKDGKIFVGETRDNTTDMSWVSKEFADLK